MRIRLATKEAPVPFPPENSFAFAAGSVRAHAPNASGVYGIFNSSQWIYVGESGDIQRRLIDHLNDTEAGIKRFSPTGFIFELQPVASRMDRQNTLSRELAVECKERLG
jgi:predicted GIY-YIG superfamily endonuclease